MFVHTDANKPLILIIGLLYYVATCVLGNPDEACRYRTTRVSNRGGETVSCFEPRGSNDPVCGTGLKSSEGCCVYIKDDQAWLKWDEKTTLRCDSTHYGNSDGECASNQSSLDCDGEISANTTPGTDTPEQQNTTRNGTPPASPRDRWFLLLPVSTVAVILLGYVTTVVGRR
ncbi:uncharacterized protein ACWYII_021477 isoform 1-T2 [Salvelinus alpinus]